MTTYTLPAFVIRADGNGIPVDAFTDQMVFVAPNSEPTFNYSVIRTESFDGLGDTNVVALDQTVISKTVENGNTFVEDTNYHAIFELTWAGNRSIVMVASADAFTRVGIVIDGDPFPQIDTLEQYYAWVNTETTLNPVTSGPFAPGQNINFSTFPAVALSASSITVGTPGPDRLEGGTDNDAFNGLDGIDTAFFAGNQSNYTLELSRSGIVLEDRSPGGQGRDTISNVEFLDFGTEIGLLNGAPLDLNAFDSGVNLTTDQFNQLIELYIAYFNRAPDAVGLLFWANDFAEGRSLSDIAQLFFDQPETRSAYASTLNGDGSAITDVPGFVTQIYTNVLGRAPDAGGRDFWIDVLEEGAVTPGFAIAEIIVGAKAAAPANATPAEIAQRVIDQQYLSDAIDIGTYFAVTRGMSDVANATNVMNIFNGSASSITAAVNATDAAFASADSATGGEFLMPLIGVLDSPF
ncbi:MAG: DUF4214 domain-containing protein [Pseudomonadota bacterium]